MNNLDKQYQELLKTIMDFGIEKKDRTGTGTKSIFGYTIRHNMKRGFPLLTTKKMYWKGIVTELLWFLRGDTNIKYLVDNNCHIWDGDAYKMYVSKCNEDKWMKEIKLDLPFQNKSYGLYTKEEFIEKIKTDDEFAKKWGDLGPVYGKQWRSWKIIYDNNVSEWVGEGEDAIPIYKVLNRHDQISNLINDLKTNPDSRRLMVNAWNVGELDQMTLPPCHYGFQVYTRELTFEERTRLYNKTLGKGFENKKWLPNEDFIESRLKTENIPNRAISLMWNQRSVDTFLGLPFNITSYGLLLEIIAKEVNMVPDELIGNLGDCHLYKNHIEQAKEQIGRELSMEEKEEWCRNNSNHMDCPMYTREPFPLPTLKYTKSLNDVDGIFKNLKVEQFQIENYQSHPTIKAPLNN